MTQTAIYLVAGLWQSTSLNLESLPDPRAYCSLPPATALGSGKLSYSEGNCEVPVKPLLRGIVTFPRSAPADDAALLPLVSVQTAPPRRSCQLQIAGVEVMGVGSTMFSLAFKD